MTLDYYLPREPEGELTLEILEEDGEVVRRYTSDAGRARGAADDEPLSSRPLPAAPGMHRFTWDARYPGVHETEGAVVWGYLGAPRAVPGGYRARLVLGGDTLTRALELRMDPRWEELTREDLQAQFEFNSALRDTLNTLFDAVRTIRDVREQAEGVSSRLRERGDEVVRRRWRDLLPAWEERRERLETLLEGDVAALNAALREAGTGR